MKHVAFKPEDALVVTNKLMRLFNDPEDSPDWAKDVIDAYVELAQVTGIVPMDSDPYGPLDFVAKILYAHACEGKSEPVRWSALREDLKKLHREQAVQTVASWANEELQAERLMGMEAKRLIPRR